MQTPHPAPNETMVQWETFDLNDPSDVASQSRFSEPMGTQVGGDDALRDGSDSTYLEAAASGQLMTWKMRPLSPVPSTPVMSVSLWARYIGSDPPGEGDGLDPYAFHIDDSFPWIEIYPDVSTLSETFTERRSGVWVRVVGKAVAEWQTNFWILRPFGYARLVEYTLWTHHEGALPLRQIQRDDHLAPGGTIRASTGTSRQGSIRARAYE